MDKKFEMFIDFDHTIFNTEEFAKYLSTSPKQINYKEFLYPDAISFIKYASGFGKTVIFSEGDPAFQKEKIDGSGIAEFASCVQIFPSYSKMTELKSQGAEIILIDDKPEVVDEAIDKGVTVIRVRRGKYKDVETKREPKFVVSSLQEIVDRDLLKSA